MQKLKTKNSAKKRFKIISKKIIKRGQAFKRHILTKKKTKNKRKLRGAANVHKSNLSSIKKMFPYK